MARKPSKTKKVSIDLFFAGLLDGSMSEYELISVLDETNPEAKLCRSDQELFINFEGKTYGKSGRVFARDMKKPLKAI